MVSFKHFATLLAASVPLVSATPVSKDGLTSLKAAVKGKYIVTLKHGVAARNVHMHMAWVRSLHERSVGRRDLDLAGVETTYGIGEFNGYAGRFDEAILEEIRNHPDVAEVEEDKIYELFGATTQAAAPWGLAAISNREAGYDSYNYDESAGANTYAYIVDSGINIGHDDFEGRVTRGYNAFGGEFTDTFGHGTMCAGIIAGKTHGVAKKANVIDVKAFEGQNSQMSVIMNGVEWAYKDIQEKKRESRAVVNLSLGGIRSYAFDQMVDTAYKNGILTVCAAGNTGELASSVSPGGTPTALTVGGIDSNWAEWDKSNYGPRVDIMAPAVNVTSSFIGSNSTVLTASGTSYAAPHVAGLALYLANLESIKEPKALQERIVQLGTRGKIPNLDNGSPNIVAYNGNA